VIGPDVENVVRDRPCDTPSTITSCIEQPLPAGTIAKVRPIPHDAVVPFGVSAAGA
jgi:hypothetical protein